MKFLSSYHPRVRAPRGMKMVWGSPASRTGGRIPPTGLVTRSSKRWCCEPDEQLDPDTCRHQGLSPPPGREESTHCRIVLSGYPASPLPQEGCHGRHVHALRGSGCAQEDGEGLSRD